MASYQRAILARFNRSSAMWPTSTQNVFSVSGDYLEFQSLKRDVAYFHHWKEQMLGSTQPSFNRSSAMWPTSTMILVPALQSPACFNRSSAMWPTSTKTFQVEPPGPVWFQSLKRDVAYFHMVTFIDNDQS